MNHSPLHDLAVKNNSEKHNHVYNGQSYLDVYHQHLAPIRESVKCVLELGVFRGCSLKMWRDYFPNAHIWGVDVDPEANKDYGERTHVLQGSQDDPAILAQAAPGESFDLIVDDGSHLVDHLIESHRLLWPRLKPGGFYFMEDLDCSYIDLTQYTAQWPGQKFNRPGTNFINDRAKFNAWIATQLVKVDTNEQVEFVHFHRFLCLLRKVRN